MVKEFKNRKYARMEFRSATHSHLFYAVMVGSFLALAGVISAPVPAAAIEGSYLYNLANFTGNVTSAGRVLFLDKRRSEVYVASNGSRAVRIFNRAGMQVYRFGDDDRLGLIRGLAVLPDGDILLLSYANIQGRPVLLRCDYRGVPKGRIPLKGIPAEWPEFTPDRMVMHGKQLYLADSGRMLVAEIDPDGKVTASWDLAKLMKIRADDATLGGFAVDDHGRLVFTSPMEAKVGILSPDGTLVTFGKRGSIAGRFGVVAGVAVDPQGRIFVVDTLRCRIIVFGPGRNHPFLGEFGRRQYRPGGLIAPDGLAVSDDGKVFVTQMSGRGVVVFRVTSMDG